MADAGEVLAALRVRDIRLMVDGDQLRYDAPMGAVTPEVVALLQQHKASLLAILAQTALAITYTTPLTPHSPCVVCGCTDRWDDGGIWRCWRCWPPGSLAQQATPHMFVYVVEDGAPFSAIRTPRAGAANA